VVDQTVINCCGMTGTGAVCCCLHTNVCLSQTGTCCMCSIPVHPRYYI
jgi:hypothetical protein